MITRIVNAANEGLVISCTNINGQNEPFHRPEIKFFLFLAISFMMLTTAFGHNSMVSCCMVFKLI